MTSSVPLLIASIARLSDACAGDMQAALLAHPSGGSPHMQSSYSALSALHAGLIDLGADVRGAGDAMSDKVRSSMTETLGRCEAKATPLYKQVMRLGADGVEGTDGRFWRVLGVFVDAHVKLVNGYRSIVCLETSQQDERLHAPVSQEIIQQAAHAAHLASSAPDIFLPDEAPPPMPYQETEGALPSYSAAVAEKPSLQTTTSRRQGSVSGSTQGESSSTGRRRATWSKIKAPVQGFSSALRGHTGSTDAALPLINELCAAVAADNAKHVEYLLEQGGAPLDGISSKDDTALGLAAEYNRVDIARLLLEAGAAPSFHSPHRMPPVFAAARENHLPLATLLLSHGADVTAKDAAGQPFIMHLVQDGCAPGIKFLLAHGASPHARDGASERSPITHAVATNDVAMSAILLAFGADPNSRDAKGRPLLAQAIANRNLALVRFLLDNGADSNARDAVTGSSVLALACEQHSVRNETVRLLLRRGADVDSTTAAGETVLVDAARRGRGELASLLLQHGASVDVKEGSGRPVLVTVVRSKGIVLKEKLGLLRTMLERGADVHAEDCVAGCTALSVARRVEGGQVVRLLEGYEK